MSSRNGKNWQYYTALVMGKLWTAVAVILVTLAVSISVVRYSLPYMDEQKHYLEQWLLAEYGADLKIGYISAIWKGSGPAIVLKDVVLAKNANSPIALSVDETHIEIDFWNSLRAQQVLSQRFNLIGMKLDVDLPRIENSGDDFPILDAMQTLFLEQLKRFSVTSSEVLLKTKNEQQRILIQQLGWLNQNDRHQGVGQMRVAELARNSARFILDLTGSKDDFLGTFYAEAEDLDLVPWLKEFIPTEYEIQRSRGNFKVWAGLHNTKITFVQGHFSESRFSWLEPESGTSVNANLMRGGFYAAPSDDGWNLDLDNFTVVVNDSVFDSDWRGALDSSGGLTLNSETPISLNPLLPLLGVMLGESVQQQVADLRPNVNLDRIQLFANPENFAAKISLSDFSTEPASQLPGLSNVYGDIYWLNNNGKLALNSRDSTIGSEKLLGYSIDYQQLSLNAFVDLSDKSTLSIPQFTLAGDTLNITQSMCVDFKTGRLTYQGYVDELAIADVKALFPADLMGKNTRAYLNRSLKSGRVKNARLLFDGVPSEFPFEAKQGVFQAEVNLENTEFSFEKNWPSIEGLDAKLLFENDSLAITGYTGTLAGIQLNQAYGILPKMAEGAMLDLNAKGVGTGTQLTNLFQNSTLRDNVGEALKVVLIEGDLSADINMSIPMSGENIVAKGVARLNDDSVSIPALDINLTEVTGELAFENEKLSTEGLQASLLGQPIRISATGNDSDEGYLTAINIEANWAIKPLIQKVHPTIEHYFDGASDWSANINLRIPKSGYFYNMQIVSQLEGINSGLPAPLNKDTQKPLRLILDSEGDKKASTVRMLLGNQVKFNGILPHDTAQFSRAHLSVGGDNFVGMGLGFSMSADLQQMQYTPWYRFVGELIDGMPTSEKPFLNAPQRIYIEAKDLHVSGQVFNDVEVLAKHRENDWLLEINSLQTRANAVVHKDWLKEGVEVNADFVKLGSWQSTEQQERKSVNERLLPPIKFVCKQCEFKEYNLGQVTLNMSRSSSGMDIDLLEMRKRDGVLSATGNWYVTETSDSTRIKGNFNSNDFGAFLKTLNFDSGIRDSDAVMDFDLSWAASPYEFKVDSLRGDIDWNLGDGYLIDVSDKGARLFSILSLDSLVRKLTGDFRDIFGKGFFYSNMEGTFQVDQGKVATQDAMIDGAAARVALEGYTDLSKNDLNYIVSVQPNVTSSLPALLAWMVNPATAVAAFALDEVLSSADVISGLQYTLTGTLQNPIMTEISRTSEEVELPAQNNLPPKPADTPSPDTEANDTEKGTQG